MGFNSAFKGLIRSNILKFVLSYWRKFYMFFWVFPRRQYVICRRFGTMYQFHLQRLEVQSTSSLWRWNWHMVPKRRNITYWRRGNTQKNMYNIQITAKAWNLQYWRKPWRKLFS